MNVDVELLEQLRNGQTVNPDSLTPETISAAYARISRNPNDVNRLRESAREEVEKARKSNEKIVFGLGHASVAEHACFNFDVIGVSRLAIEYLEHFRLASYTEKSQRYIKMEDDTLVPDELDVEPARSRFLKLVKRQNKGYQDVYREIEKVLVERGEDPKEAGLKAKEDARYVLPLAIRGQLGMTLNARTLERMIQKLAAAPLAEVREMADHFYSQTHDLVPSLVKYTKPEPYHRESGRLSDLLKESPFSKVTQSPAVVRLVNHSSDPDLSILSALMFHLRPVSWQQSTEQVRKMSKEERKVLFLELFRNMESYHPVRREFENSWFSFEMILSATAFAQLKRHRMGTILAQPYDPSLGVTTPDTFFDACVETGYYNLVDEVNNELDSLRTIHHEAADYVLTNGHRRRVLFTVNARELYHFSRLRSDLHAQWDIRELADQTIDLVKEVAPLTFLMACGKHRFADTHREVYGS